MKVYEVEPDVDRFQTFLPEERYRNSAADDFFDATPLANKWPRPEVYVLHPKLKVGDFFGFLSPGTIVATPEAYQKVEFFFDVAGEALPLIYKGREYALLNVLECIDIVDQERAEWLLIPEGEKAMLTKYAFHENRFTRSSLFKVPETCRGALLTYERSGDPEEEFKAFVEHNKMTGLLFREVWSSV